MYIHLQKPLLLNVSCGSVPNCQVNFQSLGYLLQFDIGQSKLLNVSRLQIDVPALLVVPLCCSVPLFLIFDMLLFIQAQAQARAVLLMHRPRMRPRLLARSLIDGRTSSSSNADRPQLRTIDLQIITSSTITVTNHQSFHFFDSFTSSFSLPTTRQTHLLSFAIATNSGRECRIIHESIVLYSPRLIVFYSPRLRRCSLAAPSVFALVGFVTTIIPDCFSVTEEKTGDDDVRSCPHQPPHSN